MSALSTSPYSLSRCCLRLSTLKKIPSLYEPRSLAIRVFPIFNCAYIILNNHSYSPFISAISEM